MTDKRGTYSSPIMATKPNELSSDKRSKYNEAFKAEALRLTEENHSAAFNLPAYKMAAAALLFDSKASHQAKNCDCFSTHRPSKYQIAEMLRNYTNKSAIYTH